MKTQSKIEKLLPNYNCGSCGYNTCKSFALNLLKKKTDIEKCPLLNQERYASNKIQLKQFLKTLNDDDNCEACIFGVLDHYKADIVLHPLPKEHSCREVLLPMSLINAEPESIIQYRPLGCPIVHFARVLEKNGMLLTVHMIGPSFRNESTDIGLCMVIGFEGTYTGKSLKVGETVRFLPHHCMMQKVHSGVVINIEENKIKLEGIDLKVWAPPIES